MLHTASVYEPSANGPRAPASELAGPTGASESVLYPVKVCGWAESVYNLWSFVQ